MGLKHLFEGIRVGEEAAAVEQEEEEEVEMSGLQPGLSIDRTSGELEQRGIEPLV